MADDKNEKGDMTEDWMKAGIITHEVFVPELSIFPGQRITVITRGVISDNS